MKKVKIIRGFQDDKCTLGSLTVEGEDHEPIFTLENPWKNNEPMVSCIPAGSYECSPFTGQKYKAVYQVHSVPGRTYILFHAGNYPSDTHGCILLGMGATSVADRPMVTQSRIAIEKFKKMIGNNDFRLTIHDYIKRA